MKRFGLAAISAAVVGLVGTQAAQAAVWTVQPVPLPTGRGMLASVSCASATDCIAVGESAYAQLSAASRASAQDTIPGPYLYQPLAEQWNGTGWTVLPMPALSDLSTGGLISVSCPSTTACVAVGGYDTSAGATVLLASRWNGADWTDQALPSAANSTPTLDSVSCTGRAATACIAVGGDADQATVPIAEMFNGTTWSLAPPVTVAADNDVVLSGVSCTSAGACIAVGSTGNQGLAVTSAALAEHWDGSAWSVLPTPASPAGDFTQLTAVSCRYATVCTAVGRLDNEYSTAQRWNGRAWSTQTTTNPSDSGDTVLDGVSCPTLFSCTAVGTAVSTTPAVAEQWSALRWVAQTIPAAGETPGAGAASVSCWAAGSCMAVGPIGATTSPGADSLLSRPATISGS
ncbi:MAG: hypothetical protein ABSH51_07200 [Solirubrobacteraceae bacterium]